MPKDKVPVVKPIPVPAVDHPNPPYEQLPKHEFTFGIIAPKGAGKTTFMCNLLRFYKGYFHTILVFSPTVESDSKWDWVKDQVLLSENLPLKKWLKDQAKKRDEDAIVQAPPIGMEMEGLVNQRDKFTGKIPEEHFFDDYDDETFMSIMEEQKGMIKLLKKHKMPKFIANRVLVIFDDLVGSMLYNSKYFKGVNTRHRHYSASFLMVSQGYKEVPKTIRTNWTCLILFEIGNEKEREVIYEEYAMSFTRDDWMEIYEHCIADDYGFMYINALKKEKRLRVMKNFDEYLYAERESAVDK